MARRRVVTRTRRRACAGKLVHRTPGAGWRHVARLVAQGAAVGAMEVYACRGRHGCGWWHVGHRARAARGGTR